MVKIERLRGRARAFSPRAACFPLLIALLPACPILAAGQGENTGAIAGEVADVTGAPIPRAKLTLKQPGTGLVRSLESGEEGHFEFVQLPLGAYELRVEAHGFRTARQAVALHPGESLRLKVTLSLPPLAEQVTVAEGGADMTSLNVARTQLGQGLIQNLPSESNNAALSSILTLATPGLAADSNGVFHPLGEHAETSFSVDGQPISDQQSRIFSNQISANTIQEMETLQGAPPAEFGDKTSLIVEVTTRSGLDFGGTNGTFAASYGTFSTPMAGVTLSSGSSRVGNFVTLDAVNSARFLDAPEFQTLHAWGNAESLFDRFDWRPSEKTSMHLNFTAARSWFQVPNTYDQQSAGQDQRQHMTGFNVGLAFSHVLTPTLLLTANTWVRQDRVDYYPSANLFSDQPATLAQSRRLTSTGLRTDLAYSRGRQSAKGGIQIQVTPLSEAFTTGLTNTAFNSPCVDAQGVPVADASLNSTAQCAARGYVPNSGFQPALLPYDLTRGGALFQFHGAATIIEESAYLQDSIRLGQFNLNLGLRFDNYSGLSQGYAFEPRTGLSYQVRPTGTVLHFSYARIFLTPYNENLVLSSSTGPGGLANGSLGATGVHPLTPALRNQFNTGLEQQFGSRVGIQAEYFWKYTDGAYDFNTILNTPLNFPIQFRKSKIDGVMARITLRNLRGFSAFTVLGHTRSRLFSPEIGGIDFGTAYAPVARPDHDQAFQQTTNLQYQFSRKSLRGLWTGLTWRFDSGLVVVSVPDYATALTLTGDEQQAMGLYCGGIFATVSQPLRSCSDPRFGATRIDIAAPGTFNPDTNPSRIAPRNLIDLALGADSIWKKEHYVLSGKISVVNLTDRVALYNFLSSFSGTHFVSPRTIQGSVTLHF